MSALHKECQESQEGTLITPKGFANSSPGFALKPWGLESIRLVATLKELRLGAGSIERRPNPFRVVLFKRHVSQGCQSATLGWN